jgi:hypothetical protein
MSDSTSINHSNHVDQALRLRWPVAIVIFLFTVSYPVNDFEGANSPWHHHGESDTSASMLMVFAAIALVTAIVVFAVVMPWAIHRQWIGVIALTLSVVGFLLAPGFWTGIPPAVAAGGALLGWAGVDAARGRRLSQAAFVIGILGVIANVYSYTIVFV